MNRIPPSEKIRKQFKTLLDGNWDTTEDLVSRFMLLGSQLLAQESLEQEATDYLEREHYQRRQGDQEHRGYRNGYRPAKVDTAEGRIHLQVPQVRESPEPYRSKLADFLRGNSDVLEKLAIEMYTRGLSTRDIEDAFRDVTGDLLLSRTAVSTLTDQLWEDYKTFCERDLSIFEVEYLFLDAVYESLRREAGFKEGVLVAWAICRSGRKILLHMALGNRESYTAWKDFTRDMVKRGLNNPVLITTDGAPGLIRAVDETWSKSLRQRCLTHKVQNVVNKVPENARAEVKAAINSSYRAPNRDIAEMIATDVLERYQELYPSAMKSFNEDLEACWAHLRCPAIHHKRIRTTNLLERAFGEQKRRTKVIPRFMTEQSCLKLVFATLWQVSQRWHGVRMSEFEQQQLVRLRNELGLASQDASDDSLQQVA